MKSMFKTLMLSIAVLAAASVQAAGGAAANANGVKAADRDTGAERAADRRAEPTKSQAAANSNGKRSSDRDRGRGRAADRRHHDGHHHHK